jgi:hypothetical protein
MRLRGGLEPAASGVTMNGGSISRIFAIFIDATRFFVDAIREGDSQLGDYVSPPIGGARGSGV